LLVFAAVSAVPAAVTAIAKPPAVLVWNASPSAPTGLYEVEHRAPVKSGDIVIAWAPPPARRLASVRRYLPATVPLVKPVVATAGDRVCAFGSTIFINGRAIATRLRTDPSGRPMPWWAGCPLLGPGELFLLSRNAPDAFDGRYFGVTVGPLVIGRARLLWPR
jgi:conjugative transfer signal peptidase TraF